MKMKNAFYAVGVHIDPRDVWPVRPYVVETGIQLAVTSAEILGHYGDGCSVRLEMAVSEWEFSEGDSAAQDDATTTTTTGMS